MERNYEEILHNTTPENVLRYLHKKLQGIHNVGFDETLADGTIFCHTLYVYSIYSNKIEITYSTTTTPRGDSKKTIWFLGQLSCYEI